jgi:hypothetical protein
LRSLSFILLFIVSTGIASARTVQLSPEAEISVITCSPGQEALYASFGHSAIRVNDPKHSIDLAYNYGVFDFNQPNFYLNFAKGYLNYKLGVSPFERFVYVYKYYNRPVYEQVLDLTQDEKQKLYDFLVENAKPENRYYFYDYFYNNCATKVWDAVESEIDAIVFDSTYVQAEMSFRDLVDIYAEQQSWGDFGIDVCLGLPMDKQLSPKEFMFLPDYIFKSFEKARLKRNGELIPAVKQTNTLYEFDPERAVDHSSFWTPVKVFWAIFILMMSLTLYGTLSRKKMAWLDIVLFSIFGLLGWFLAVLWIFTDHQAASANMNLLWANPLNLLAAIMLMVPEKPRYVRSYFRYNFYFLLLVMVCWYFIPQGYNPAFFPIVGILAMRSWFIADRLTVLS